jgi:hypothetical protein
MAKRRLSNEERHKVAETQIAKARLESLHGTVRVIVAPETNEAGEPQYAVAKVMEKPTGGS